MAEWCLGLSPDRKSYRQIPVSLPDSIVWLEDWVREA